MAQWQFLAKCLPVDVVHNRPVLTVLKFICLCEIEENHVVHHNDLISTKRIPMQETARDTSVPLSSRAARLSGLRIGMWRSRKHETLWLIVAPKYSKFVFVVEQQDTKVETPRRGALQRRSSMLRQLGAHSPFTASSVYTEKSRVFCFDVRYSDIRGVDYLNPLVRSGKLVLDAFHVSKREFADVRILCDSWCFFCFASICGCI